MKTLDEELIRKLVREIIAQLPLTAGGAAPNAVPVGVSGRHLHVSVRDAKILFGTTYQLTKMKDLMQPAQFAAEETVTLVGPKGVIRGVRILGPERKQTQIEISRTDGFTLGVTPPVRQSGDLKGSAGIVIVGPRGAVTLDEGLIVAARHLHLSVADGVARTLQDKDLVGIEVPGERGLVFRGVLVRCGPDHATEYHVDTDEANAAGICTGAAVTLVRD